MYLYASKTLNFENLGNEVSEKVESDFNNEHSVNYEDIHFSLDRFLQVLALVYDLNFKYSFMHLKKYKTIWQIYENINNENLKPYFEKIDNYIERKIREE